MLRKTTSLVLAFSGLFVLVTSVILYIQPEGRVAYWAGWKLLGIGKKDWGELHINTGILFLAALIAHAAINWKALAAYVGAKARQAYDLRPLALAAGLTLLVAAGGPAGLPPMRQVAELNSWVKERQARVYGTPPYGHAELSSLDQFLGHLGIEPAVGRRTLEQAGIEVSPDAGSIQDIARANRVTPQYLYESLRSKAAQALPAAPPEGAGRLTLRELCAQYGLDVRKAASGLAARGVRADGETAIRQLASDGGMTPHQMYALIREAAAP